MHFDIDREIQQLHDVHTTIRRLTDIAAQLEDHIAASERVAHLLEHELAAMRSVLTPVQIMHTPATWAGRSADSSRRRLDQHHTEHTVALRRIDRTIDDLLAMASATRVQLDQTHVELSTSRRAAAALEIELGHFDDVLI